ncbi:type VI secretion system lipoprotein TssJ [Endozoicomonas sp. GU-1]|uniref:type VI secretion system lipoprotein TssJ n=2 Tax=Endozoicomonas sp. GU-1 TaxID=3009078 RepID=UPI0022B5CC26|nr:type VI secretion system lipoprotein TssJ [Endozoicomonas sp. GU-1]WBA88897.1 type VI secretion system lipoprotein TssJ [Endozoicomonas sp. GU-1]
MIMFQQGEEMIRYAMKMLLILLCTTPVGCSSGLTSSGLTAKEAITINITASEILNPYLGNEQNPLFIQVVQLKQIDRFQSLDFISLYQDIENSLGKDLIYLEQSFPIKPGTTVTKSIKPEMGTNFIGLLYFFSNFEQATTRHWLATQPGKKQCFDVFFNNNKGVLERCK